MKALKGKVLTETAKLGPFTYYFLFLGKQIAKESIKMYLKDALKWKFCLITNTCHSVFVVAVVFFKSAFVEIKSSSVWTVTL